jgi:hypothetical protein
MDRVRFITHQGKQILFIDVTNCAAEEVIELLTEVQRIVTAQPPKSVRRMTASRSFLLSLLASPESAVFDLPSMPSPTLVRDDG